VTRIIAGRARGRRLSIPTAGTRPTSDRTREALFSSLMSTNALPDAHVLDLYAGSGALGLEAVSRGAVVAVLVERDKAAAAVCRKNADLVDAHAVTVLCADVGWLVFAAPQVVAAPFDLVFIDPPYETADEVVVDVLRALAANAWLTDLADVIIERKTGATEFAWPPGFAADRRRVYGSTVLWYGHWVGPVA
jgi:16S rRNA (guanine966-N2)-methyltransferase